MRCATSLLLFATLAAATACGDDPPPPRPPTEQETPKKPTGPPGRSGETHTLGPSASGKQKSIHVGDRVLVEIDGASKGVAPEHHFAWGDPQIKGDAVRFVNREDKGPPPHIDGGRFTHVFELRAVALGRAKLTIPVKDKGEKADASPYTIDFTVALPD